MLWLIAGGVVGALIGWLLGHPIIGALVGVGLAFVIRFLNKFGRGESLADAAIGAFEMTGWWDGSNSGSSDGGDWFDIDPD